MLLELLAKNWWVFVLRGVLAILFGLGTYVMPGVSLAALILVYGAYALSDGVVAVVGAVTGRAAGERLDPSLILIGLVGVAAGLTTFVYPGLTALLLLYFIAGWHIVRGLTEIIVAIRLRKEIEGEFGLALAGVGSVLFGLFLAARPGAGALAWLWLIAGFSIVFGVVSLALGFKLRARARN